MEELIEKKFLAYLSISIVSIVGVGCIVLSFFLLELKLIVIIIGIFLIICGIFLFINRLLYIKKINNNSKIEKLSSIKLKDDDALISLNVSLKDEEIQKRLKHYKFDKIKKVAFVKRKLSFYRDLINYYIIEIDKIAIKEDILNEYVKTVIKNDLLYVEGLGSNIFIFLLKVERLKQNEIVLLKKLAIKQYNATGNIVVPIIISKKRVKYYDFKEKSTNSLYSIGINLFKDTFIDELKYTFEQKLINELSKELKK